mmetsp:Transcript_4048/g.16146  ORF Transcript_4048/g.16146 Transcript_4048/m.16146 type:complete len:200 (+) Transcript_4048:671-1270(+)
MAARTSSSSANASEIERLSPFTVNDATFPSPSLLNARAAASLAIVAFLLASCALFRVDASRAVTHFPCAPASESRSVANGRVALRALPGPLGSGSTPRQTNMPYPSSLSWCRNSVKYRSEMGRGAGNVLLKFHQPVAAPACTFWSAMSHRRSVSQWRSRLQMNARSRCGACHAVPASWLITGRHFRFQVSSARVNTCML